jgi:hypothetical protein
MPTPPQDQHAADEKLRQSRMLAAYKKHPHRRFVEMDDNAIEELTCVYEGCLATQPSNADKLFHQFLERLRDEGSNVLRPAPLEPEKLPEPFRDAQGKPLPNPWETGNKKDQRSLLKNNPDLAHRLRREAEEPYTVALERAERESERLARNKREIEYTAEIHAKSPFVSGTRGDQAAWINAMRDLDPDADAVIRQFMRESQPISVRIVANQNRTLIHGITRTDKVLGEVIKAAQQRKRTIDIIRHERREAERLASVRRAIQDQKNLAEAKAGLTRLPDGRTITLPNAARA